MCYNLSTSLPPVHLYQLFTDAISQVGSEPNFVKGLSNQFFLEQGLGFGVFDKQSWMKKVRKGEKLFGRPAALSSCQVHTG